MYKTSTKILFFIGLSIFITSHILGIIYILTGSSSKLPGYDGTTKFVGHNFLRVQEGPMTFKEGLTENLSLLALFASIFGFLFLAAAILVQAKGLSKIESKNSLKGWTSLQVVISLVIIVFLIIFIFFTPRASWEGDQYKSMTWYWIFLVIFISSFVWTIIAAITGIKKNKAPIVNNKQE